MKHLIYICLLTGALFISGCKKYEDGPAFSLMTRKARLSNIWQVEKYILNGEDKTVAYRQLISRERLVIYQSGNFDYSEVSSWLWAAPQYSGKWNFIDRKESVEFVPENSARKPMDYRILKLKKDELWLERQVSADSLVEYHYAPVDQY